MANLAVDEMHTVHLGVCAAWVAHCLWAIVDSDVWNLGGGLPSDARHRSNSLQVRRELSEWFEAEKAARVANPGNIRLQIYEVGDFTLNTLGSKVKPSLAGPTAAETGTLVPLTLQVLTPSSGTCRSLVGLWKDSSPILADHEVGGFRVSRQWSGEHWWTRRSVSCSSL